MLLPELVLARSATRRLRFWSAACAAGEEPATLALVLDESPLLAGWDWRILATDLDPEALAHARRGLYGERAVAGVPGRMLAASFTRRGALYELDARLRARIDFQPLNLARLPYRLAEPSFDLILLRNVLIYFRQELQAEVVAEAARAGWRRPARSSWAAPRRSGGCRRRCTRSISGAASVTACRRPPRLPASARLPLPGRSRRPAREPALRTAPRRHRSQRRWHLAMPAATVAAATPPTAPSTASGSWRRSDIWNPIDSTLPPARRSKLWRATRRILRRTFSSGLVHELAGRADAAADAFRAALYLEPDLPQVRFRLANCLRRAGKAELADAPDPRRRGDARTRWRTPPAGARRPPAAGPRRDPAAGARGARRSTAWRPESLDGSARDPGRRAGAGQRPSWRRSSSFSKAMPTCSAATSRSSTSRSGRGLSPLSA